MKTLILLPLGLALALACGEADTDDESAPADTIAAIPGGAASGAGSGGAVSDETTVAGGGTTTATSVEATGAPSPPEGYAVDSRPAGEGRLARVEYASTRTVSELGAFYDSQIDPARRVELETAGDNLIVYGLSPGTSVGPSTTPMDVREMLDRRTEPILVVSPWTLQRDDPLIGDLREAGLAAEADRLANTKSKVTVVYAVE